ncbi:biotin--protein ligase [Anopheles nili]|uniref:biotin--protein ligase n=1 Tax=Anopheles nili TaxID=185578 RepID=UPI00237C4F76|nr:biotin--protein ligase [Anopheles nili]
MLLTLVYLAMTIRTSLKFRCIRNNLRKLLIDRYAISFYTTSNGDSTAGLDSPDAALSAHVSSCIWFLPNQRGCLVYPVQRTALTHWTTVPQQLQTLQLACDNLGCSIVRPASDSIHVIVTLESLRDLVESHPSEQTEHSVMLNRFGRFLAWNRTDRGLQVLLDTDTERLFQLIVATFGSGQFHLDSGRLKLVQLESVETFGEPMPFKEPNKWTSQSRYNSLPTDAWLSTLMDIEKETLPATQAAIGIQPDIISSNDIRLSLEKIDETALPSQCRPSLLSSGSNSRNRSQLDLTDGLTSGTDHGAMTPLEDSMASSIVADEKTKETEKATETDTMPTINDKEMKQPVAPMVEVAEAKAKTPITVPPEEQTNTLNGTVMRTEDTIDVKPIKPADQEKATSLKNEKTTPHESKGTRSLRKSSFPSSRLRLGIDQTGVVTKPPNILVYSDSTSTMEYVIATLNNLLEPNTCTIYPITTAQALARSWQQSTVLIIVAGSLDINVRKILLDYFLHGGVVFSLCSDLLDIILPDSKTAEIRERELVSFSYRKWKQIKMLHHIFCYQLSPAKKQFSLESEETATLLPVSYVDVTDLSGKQHSLTVEILAQEETWNTPSILEAHNRKTGGKAIFSQIHLELDPSQFQSNIDAADKSLQNSNQLRYEILSDLLGGRVGLKLRDKGAGCDDAITYKNAYFLGKHEAKVEMLETLKDTMSRPNVIQTSQLTLQFCGKSDKTPNNANETHLPVMIVHCPEDFSTVQYFENLTTRQIGRIGIYAPIMASSMQVVSNLTLTHGFMVISRHQTKGKGRNNNQWLSPPGCAMFSLQLHIPMSSSLGQRLPIVQHLVAVAVVSAVLSLPGYEKLPLGLKWPNDIYAYGATKLGGSIFNTQIDASTAVVNIGVGLNLSNSKPTLCLNDVIAQYNAKHTTVLPLLSYEKTFALIFNKLEELYDSVQNEGVEKLQNEYYRHWLHQDAEISMIGPEGESLQGTIVGIDEYGFLLVKKQPSGDTVSVHPDGNSFDMMEGLIIPKFN